MTFDRQTDGSALLRAITEPQTTRRDDGRRLKKPGSLRHLGAALLRENGYERTSWQVTINSVIFSLNGLQARRNERPGSAASSTHPVPKIARQFRKADYFSNSCYRKAHFAG